MKYVMVFIYVHINFLVDYINHVKQPEPEWDMIHCMKVIIFRLHRNQMCIKCPFDNK